MGHDYSGHLGIRGHDYSGHLGIRGHDYSGHLGICGHVQRRSGHVNSKHLDTWGRYFRYEHRTSYAIQSVHVEVFTCSYMKYIYIN
jgi:hypothetical protein